MTATAAPLALDPAETVHAFYPTLWWIPAGILAAALAIKLPGIIRLWRDPLMRAVGGLLLLACAVFVFVAPSTIGWINRVTGVPNIAAPWAYSLLTAFSSACLLLIVTWRDGPADRTDRTDRTNRTDRMDRMDRTRRVRGAVRAGYLGVIVALWVLFLLAEMPRERLRDLDTYYADTPYAREMILLYLLAHTVAGLIVNRLIWDWVSAGGLDVWLRAGLRLLGVGFALQLLFDAVKLTAVAARWSGRNLDWLSTAVAPPLASLSAVLVAAGFILPHAGQYLRDRRRLRLAHRELRPLYLLMRSVHGGGPPRALRAGLELRLIRRETFIRDVLLPLGRFLDEDLRRRSCATALSLGFPADQAAALAAAVTILDAAEHRPRKPPTTQVDTTALLRDIGAVSRALGRRTAVERIRSRVSAGAQGVSVAN
ncbi:DUF6545 domain-containing protein [Streptomyces sp. NPDC052773]|uniref:DUF6545 domain-containing protein n=1 Tax=Streptomyces sp. NPDC052773 TaxID=3365693 RepID=UPI0037D33668